MGERAEERGYHHHHHHHHHHYDELPSSFVILVKSKMEWRKQGNDCGKGRCPASSYVAKLPFSPMHEEHCT